MYLGMSGFVDDQLRPQTKKQFKSQTFQVGLQEEKKMKIRGGKKF